METIDLMSVIKDVMKNLVTIILLSIAIMLMGHLALTLTHKPVYETKMSYVITSTDSTEALNTYSQSKLINVFKEVVESNILKKNIATALEYENGVPATISTEIIQDTSGEVAKNLNILVITVQASTPKDSFEVARAMEESCPQVAKQANENLVVKLLEEPTMAQNDSKAVNYLLMDLLFFLLSCAAMVFIAAQISIRRDTIRSPEDIKNKLASNLLAAVPDVEIKSKNKAKNKFIPLVTESKAGWYYIESIKKIRSKTEHLKSSEGGICIAVTSVASEEGKTTIAANTALSLALNDNKVLLVDLDIKKPAIAELTKSEVKYDCSAFLSGKQSFMETVTKKKNLPLWMLLQKTPLINSSEIIASKNMKSFLSFAQQNFDFIIIDTPSISSSADMETLSSLVDNVMLVVKQDTVKATDLSNAISMLDRNKCNLIGCVYNGDTSNGASGSYGYGYGYGKYNSYKKSGYGYGKYSRSRSAKSEGSSASGETSK